MILRIFTPQSDEIDSEVSKVFLPGAGGRFEVLNNHAPLLSSLTAGQVRWCVVGETDEKTFNVESGFVRVENNEVTVIAGK